LILWGIKAFFSFLFDLYYNYWREKETEG